MEKIDSVCGHVRITNSEIEREKVTATMITMKHFLKGESLQSIRKKSREKLYFFGSEAITFQINSRWTGAHSNTSWRITRHLMLVRQRVRDRDEDRNSTLELFNFGELHFSLRPTFNVKMWKFSPFQHWIKLFYFFLPSSSRLSVHLTFFSFSHVQKGKTKWCTCKYQTILYSIFGISFHLMSRELPGSWKCLLWASEL